MVISVPKYGVLLYATIYVLLATVGHRLNTIEVA